MDFELNDEETLLSEAASKFAAQATPGAACFAELAEMGWYGTHIPEDAGGFGLGMTGCVILAEALGLSGLSDPFLGHAVLASGALAASPDHAEVLGGAIEGTVRLGAALAETDRTYDLAAVQCTATASEGGYRLSGRKGPALGCQEARSILVSARLENDEAALFLVSADTEGLSVTPIAGPDGRDLSTVVLDNVAVDETARIVMPAGGLAQVQSWLHVALAADSCGAMHRLVETTRDYLVTRQQFGRPIGSFQTLQHRFADMHVALDEARSLMLAAAMASDGDSGDAADLARKAWIQACWSARRISEEAVQMHGAIGMTSECQVGDFVKRLAANQQLAGHPELHVGLLATQMQPS